MALRTVCTRIPRSLAVASWRIARQFHRNFLTRPGARHWHWRLPSEPSLQLLPCCSAAVDALECGKGGGAGDMDVLLMAAGTLGDVLPFLALAMHLAVRYGHRVRLASHADYGPLVLQCMERMAHGSEAGEQQGRGGDGGQGEMEGGEEGVEEEGEKGGVLGSSITDEGSEERMGMESSVGERAWGRGEMDFYPLAGDPTALSTLMVRNGGVFPRSFSELRLLRQQYRAILESTWPACTAAFPHPAGAPSTGRVSSPFPQSPSPSPLHILSSPPSVPHISPPPASPTAAYAHPFAPSALRSLAYLSPAILRGQLHRGSYRLVEAFVGAGVMDITNQVSTAPRHPGAMGVHPSTLPLSLRIKSLLLVFLSACRALASVPSPRPPPPSPIPCLSPDFCPALIVFLLTPSPLSATLQFRTRTLHLDPLFLTDRPFSHLLRLPIPFSFSWSPLLAPKPSDWSDLVDVVGFIHPPLHHAPSARAASAASPATPSPSPSEGEARDTAPSPESPALPALEEEAARPAAAAAVAAAEGEAGEAEEQWEHKPAPACDPTPPSPPSFHPSPALVSFLAEGPAPLFLAYGSMQLSKPCYVACCVLKAVALLGVRAIIGSAAIRQHRCCSSSHCLVAAGRTRKRGKGDAGVGRSGEEGRGKKGRKGGRGRHAERSVEGGTTGGSVEGGGTQEGAEEEGGGGEGGGEGESEVVQQGSVLFVGSVAHDWLFPHCSATPGCGPACSAHPPHLPSPPPLLAAPAAAAPSQGACHAAQEQLSSRVRAPSPTPPHFLFFQLPSAPTFPPSYLAQLCRACPPLPRICALNHKLRSKLHTKLLPALTCPNPLLTHLLLSPPCCPLTSRRGDGLLRAADSFHLHLPPRLHRLLQEGQEGADSMPVGSRASDVVERELCGRAVPWGGGELEGVHESCVGSSQQQKKQGVAGQVMEEKVRGHTVQQEAETSEVEGLPRRRRFWGKNWVVGKWKRHQEQPCHSQVNSLPLPVIFNALSCLPASK
ncbi:unnamed protein product [Closterium sp. Naga37s-1]|nr:unnamed protein product [Closterium sp. Naga37s-1]